MALIDVKYPNNVINLNSEVEYKISTIDFEGRVLTLMGRFSTKDTSLLKRLSNSLNSNPFSGKHNWHIFHKGVTVDNAYKLIESFLERIAREKV